MIRKSFLADFSDIKFRALSTGRRSVLMLRGGKGAAFIYNVHAPPRYSVKLKKLALLRLARHIPTFER
eukprot:8357843-Pyramimonas_sp.AAC.1